MNCYLCEREAVSRCYTCGQLICAEHGKDDCQRCATSVVAGDPRSDRVSAAPLARQEKHGWWRPQQAEEYAPPACYACEGIARRTCRNCRERYCPEHAGPPELCADCGRSSRLGLFFLVFAVLMLAGILLAGYLQAP